MWQCQEIPLKWKEVFYENSEDFDFACVQYWAFYYDHDLSGFCLISKIVWQNKLNRIENHYM